jgi:hypothetical protein
VNARTLGKERGHAAATWVFDGNTPRETYEWVLKGYEDGDPEVLDMEPAPLSGEWADSPTPSSLVKELDLAETEDEETILREYEEAYSVAFWHEVIRVARYQTEFL